MRIVEIVLVGALVAAGVGALPLTVYGQANCGTFSTSHTMRQTPNYRQSVDVSASTTRSVTSCPLQVQTEAWVDALSPSYVSTNRQLYAAAVNQTRAVPRLGTWKSTARHWLIWTLTGQWNSIGNTYAETQVIASLDAGSRCEITADDCIDGYQFEPWRCDCVSLSPILIDTRGDGYSLTSSDDGVTFDLDANGRAIEKIAWTEPESDDAWLVLDRDGNGRIDSGAELFGSRTPAYAEGSSPLAANGFEALLLTEGPDYGGGIPDEVIDNRDAVFARLRLWFDRNHNGVTDRGELVPLNQVGIVAIKTDYRRDGRRDRFGNRFALQGTAVFRLPNGRLVDRAIYDVFLTVAGSGGTH